MKVELVAYTHFNREILKGVGMSDAVSVGGAELLIEFAGRNCYQSFSNPAGRTNTEYVENILKQGHGSVLEHSSATFFITGVSRSLTHELIRHRHLSFSELSQRFVNVEDAEFVVPPAVRGVHTAEAGVGIAFGEARKFYTGINEELEKKGLPRKQSREAARCVMPNCTETKIACTGNFRSWRQFIEARGSEHADAEIRALAVEVCLQLSARFPAVFADCLVTRFESGVEGVSVKWSKV